MKALRNAIVLNLLLLHLFGAVGYTCTTLVLKSSDQNLFGANLDWVYTDGLIIINKRGLVKTSLHKPQKHKNPIKWKSTYGSVTFTIFGQEWAWGGINETGLACSTMNLEETKYPSPDNRPSIHGVQYLQFQLDNFSTVEEVVSSDKEVRIRPVAKGLGSHYLFSDKFGKTAIIEFLDGKMVARIEDSTHLRVLANSTFEESLKYSKRFRGLGGWRSPIDDDHSLNRFVRAAIMLKDYEKNNSIPAVPYVFGILDNVAFKDGSQMPNQWNIVYDLKNLCIYFRSKGNRSIGEINLKIIDFSCSSPARFIKMGDNYLGEVNKNFKELTSEINKDMFKTAIRKTPYDWKVPENWLDRISRYPDKFKCDE